MTPSSSCERNTDPFRPAPRPKAEARKLGFGFLLRYEHVIDANENIQEVRCIFIELPRRAHAHRCRVARRLHTRCATCGETSVHEETLAG